MGDRNEKALKEIEIYNEVTLSGKVPRSARNKEIFFRLNYLMDRGAVLLKEDEFNTEYTMEELIHQIAYHGHCIYYVYESEDEVGEVTCTGIKCTTYKQLYTILCKTFRTDYKDNLPNNYLELTEEELLALIALIETRTFMKPIYFDIRCKFHEELIKSYLHSKGIKPTLKMKQFIKRINI